MRTRRCILKSAPFVAAAAVFPTSAQSSEHCSSEFAARLLAAALKNEQGGSWRVSFDRLNTFVLISKEN